MFLTDIKATNKDGKNTFNSKYINSTDSNGNKKVSFNVSGNTLTTVNGSASDFYEVMSFTGERVSNDSIIAGNMVVNTYLDVKSSIFCSSSVNSVNVKATNNVVCENIIYAGKSSGTPGRIKMFDISADEWVDFVIDNKTIYLDGAELSGGSSVTIDDTTISSTTVFSSEKITTLIDDFDKIDAYLGAFTYTNSSLFDKYNEIDILFGKIIDSTATQDEINLVATLDEQLGLLSEIDNNLVDYIDLQLGK